MTISSQRQKITADEYDQMVESGILSERDRIELIEGAIIPMAAIGRQHAACVDRANEIFVLNLSSRAIVRVQNPVRLSNLSEPEPDLAILRKRSDFYAQGHPQPQDVFALVEVADTTIQYNRGVKIPLYAREGIAEVWLVDLNEEAIAVYRDPIASGYLQVQTFRRGEEIALLAFPEISFPSDRLLG